MMKILCSLGTHSQDFSRMAKAVDELAGIMTDTEFVVQTGVTCYDFKHVKEHFDYCSKEKMIQLMNEADILILQGGWGGMEEAVDCGKKCVVIPRIEGAEHVHNQEQLVKKMDSLGCVVGCFDEQELESCVRKAMTMEVKPLKKGDATDEINRALKEWFC